MSRIGLAILLVVVALVLANGATFTVQEYEQALVTRLGKIRGGPVTQPGLHFKLPFVEDVKYFDKRWLEWDGDPNEIPTGDKKYIGVDTYARWRISDPVRFYKRMRDENSAQTRLDDIIDGEVRNVLAAHDVIEIVRASSRTFEFADALDDDRARSEDFKVKKGREVLRRLILKKASEVMPDYGIELADVRIKRVNYVESVQEKVFERMISERNRIAARYRSEGQGKSAEIRGRIEKDLKTIQSEAYKRAQDVRGQADAKATAIYAAAYNRDPKFYEFLKSLETYQKTIDKDATLVLSTSSDLFKYLKNTSPR